MIENLTECYRILELAPGATQEEVKRSYRELVKVWHPDRFTGDPKLQKKAQEKLKQINLAYEWICKGEAGGPRRRTAHAGKNASQAGEQSRPSGSSSSTNNRSESRAEAPRQPPPPTQPTPAPTTNWGRRIVQFAVTVVIIAVIKAVFSTSDRPRRQTTDYAPPNNQPSQSYRAPETPAVQPMPKARQHLTLDQIVDLHGEALKRRPDLGMSVQEFSRYMQANQTDYDFSEGIASSPPPNTQPAPVPPQVTSSPLPEQPTAHPKAESTADELLASSKASAESPRQVEVALAKTRNLVSPTPSSPTRDFFTVGSTKDEALAVQGTPSQFDDSAFHFGTSDVFFENGRVKSWYDGFPKLRAKLFPTSQVERREFFTVGSTKDEVLAVQGTPSQFNDSAYHYGTSDVFFEKDRVKSWYDGFPKLKAKLLPSAQVERRDFFTIGSTKDEVLAVQGTPSQFTDSAFHYGTSDVFFEKGRVKSWYDGFPKLKARMNTGSQPSKQP